MIKRNRIHLKKFLRLVLAIFLAFNLLFSIGRKKAIIEKNVYAEDKAYPEFVSGKDFNTTIRKLINTKGDGTVEKDWQKKPENLEGFIRAYKYSPGNAPTAKISVNNSSDILAWFDRSSGNVYWYTDSNRVYLNKDASYMFFGFNCLSQVDFSGVNTSRVTNMASMFDMHDYDLSKVGSMLTSLNLSNFDTSNVTNMYHMFFDCRNLRQLNISSFDTSKVTDMAGMFMNCPLKNLDLSNFRTDNVTDMAGMFNYCTELENLNIKNFNTSKVTDMSAMFHSCYNLENLNLSSFDTSRVVEMENMLSGISPKTLVLGRKFKFVTSKIGNAGLESYNDSSERYSGKYTRNDENNHKDAITAEQLMKMYDGRKMAGKWVPEVKDITKTTATPTMVTTSKPTLKPTSKPTANPTPTPTVKPTATPTVRPTTQPTAKPTQKPTSKPTVRPTTKPTSKPSSRPASKPSAEKTVTMYRAYNPNSGEHFYTRNKKEFDHIVSLGWKNEGVGWIAPQSSKTPVYRLYNANGGEHHYTSNAKEKNALTKAGWKDEGIGWYSDDSKRTPLYRQYNPNAFANNHNYTTSKKENDTLVKLGWRYEGIGWYGVRAR